MLLAQKSFQADRVFAAIVLITLFSLLLLGAVVLIERALLPWEFARRKEELS
jgi:ABC-type nitrate/sulfonate/bicarbonate transport system permease component